MSNRRALAALKTCIDSKGWLFFFTHDVSKSPTAYGAPADLMEELAQRAVETGAVLATPSFGAALTGVTD